MSDMPDVLSVSLTGGEWAAYQCRSGRGGKNETVYIKEALAEEKAEAELQEKLSQQREAFISQVLTLDRALTGGFIDGREVALTETVSLTSALKILTATIGNNGEEG